MIRRLPSVLAAALAVVAIAAATSPAQEFTREFDFSGDRLTVTNLVGEFEVRAASDDAFRVIVTVAGNDAREELIAFEVDETGGNRLDIRFPVDEHDDYVYPALGRRTEVDLHINHRYEGGSWLKKIFADISKKHITVRSSGKGLEMWADVVVEVPRGSELEVLHGVGVASAADVEADLVLDTYGSIGVARIKGDVLCDTGSGSVDVTGVEGSVNVDTGSGDVAVSDCDGPEVLADTGSGRVIVKNVDCNYLMVDTGSGNVRAHMVKADRVKIDTGSGDAELQLDRMGDGDFVIDTGSGDIELVLPAGASARITADTGSGRIRSEVPGGDIERHEGDELEMTVGEGQAKVTLDAGSGSITIRGE